jgi:hypothetical protein
MVRTIDIFIDDWMRKGVVKPKDFDWLEGQPHELLRFSVLASSVTLENI